MVIAPDDREGLPQGGLSHYDRRGRNAARRRRTMAKGQKRSNKEVRKPKADKPKKNAANASTKGLLKDASR
jgi:hypothetical protein